jgi:hypothetical protein
MPNPNPRTEFLVPIPRIGDEPLATQVLGTKVPKDIDAAVRALPNRSEWLRRVITEAAQRELLRQGDDEVTV